MPEDNARPAPSMKQGTVLAQPGQPLQFTESEEIDIPNATPFPMGEAIAETLRAYTKAARKLLDGKYAGQKQLAPPHMREPCNVSVLRCNDGIFVRYDLAPEGEAKIRCADSGMNLAKLSPQFSEQVIHFPPDPSTYIPEGFGPELRMFVANPQGEIINEVSMGHPLIFATTTFPDNFQIPQPPARPPCLVAVLNEFDFQIGGLLVPSEKPVKHMEGNVDHFIVHSRQRLPVGWETIEIYPLLGIEYWKPEYAPLWAELDLLATIAQKNATASTLQSLDGRGAARQKYAALFQEFETLLAGPEEPAHQFLKDHPELLCPTHDRSWSKLAFGQGPGKKVSDFVFREPFNDYLLVEIEAPYRELFRKNGQQREELTHAINQIADWVQYIADNKQEVEEKLGLAGISTSPRMLVVIGRSASLTDDNRRKLVTLQVQQPKMRILTYDDLIATARANLERILGSLTLEAQNANIYYYKASSQPAK